jgi:hypothetical protein
VVRAYRFGAPQNGLPRWHKESVEINWLPIVPVRSEQTPADATDKPAAGGMKWRPIGDGSAETTSDAVTSGIERLPKVLPRGKVVEDVDLEAAARNRNDKRAYLGYPGCSSRLKTPPRLRNAPLAAQIYEHCRVPTAWKHGSKKAGRVYKHMVSMARNTEIAAEITVETMEAALTSQFSADKGELHSWLFKIAENKWKDHLDKATQNGTIATQEYSPLMDEISTPAGNWETIEVFVHGRATASQLRKRKPELAEDVAEALKRYKKETKEAPPRQK